MARGVLHAERARRATCSVTLVGARRIRSLNRQHLGRDRPTDVIAFRLADAPTHGTAARGSRTVVGDVYVCVPVALAQARRFGTSPREELRRLVIHGVLHVLGYDHPAGRGRTAGAMWRRQERLLERAGAAGR